jgi:antitoxin Phd
MNKLWQLQEAKNCFSEVVNEALLHGPQIITRHGQETAVLMSIADYKKKLSDGKSLINILRGFPKDIELDLARDKSTKSRDLQL